MVIVWGSRLYGKCDVVPGLFHVATKFGHLWYLPLIPMGTQVITAQQGDAWSGVPVSLSFKSIMLAWVRAFLIVFASGAMLMALVFAADGKKHEPWIGPAITAALMWTALFLSYSKFVSCASFARAMQLGREVGLNQLGMAEIEKIYGEVAPRGFEVKKPAAAMTAPRPAAQPAAARSTATSRPRPMDDGGAIPLEPAVKPMAKKRPDTGPIGLR